MAEKIQISKLSDKNLKYLYLELGKSCKFIGDLVGLTEDAILWRLNKLGINGRNKGVKDTDVEIVYIGERKDKKKELTEEKLLELYRQDFSDAAIGKMFGMTGEAVAYRRNKYGISLREKNSQYKSEKFSEIPKEALEKDFYSMTNDKFAQKYKISKMVWSKSFKERGIVGKFEKRESQYPPFTKKQRNVIIGGLLGDGSVSEEDFYYESHAKNQIQYLMKKYEILKPYTESPLFPVDNGTGMRFKTVHHSNFREFHKYFYRDGIKGKHIPVDFIKENWDDEILAYWFLDDGYYNDASNEFFIFNKCPDKNQLISFIGFLNKKYNWDFKILNTNNVVFSKKYIEDFVKILLLVATPDLYYKIPEKYLNSQLVSKVNIKSIDDIPPKFYRVGENKGIIENIVCSHLKSIEFPFINMTDERKEYHLKLFVNNVWGKEKNGIIDGINSGKDLCESYFPNQYQANIKGYPNPISLWGTDEFTKILSKNLLNNADRLTDSYIREGVKNISKMVPVLKPTIAKFLYEKYNSNFKVLDFSSGYGTRLLAAMTLGLEYTGYEPDTITYSNLKAFGDFLRLRTSGNFEILNECSEEASFKENYYGFAFSSPPYFDFDIYSDGKSQSVKKFTNYQDWLHGFWYKVIDSSKLALIKEGNFGICLPVNICKELLEDTLNYCRLHGFVLIRQYNISSELKYDFGELQERILIFRKI